MLLDVDGTLVDTNYLHVIAWQRALRETAGLELPGWVLHRTVGKGGDRFVAAVAGARVEQELGDAIRSAHGERYGELIDEVRPIGGARELLVALKEREVAVVLASSATAGEVDRYLDLLGARDLLDGWTTSDDVASSKPAPDLVEAALARAPRRPALLVGDTVWDAAAAARAGIPFVAVLSGGISAAELRDAGAVAIYDGPSALRADLDGAGIAPPPSRTGPSGDTRMRYGDSDEW